MGWGFDNKTCVKYDFETHFYFFSNSRWGTLLSCDHGLKGDSSFKALLRSHLASVRGPISYILRIMVHMEFFNPFPKHHKLFTLCGALTLISPLLLVSVTSSFVGFKSVIFLVSDHISCNYFREEGEEGIMIILFLQVIVQNWAKIDYMICERSLT